MLASAGKQSHPTNWPGFAQEGKPHQRSRFVGGSGALLLLLLGLFVLLSPGCLLAAILETPSFRLTLSPETGRYEIQDKQANVTWRSNPYQAQFGAVTVRLNGQPKTLALAKCEIKETAGQLEATFRPLPSQPAASLRVRIQVLEDQRTLEFTYDADPSLAVEKLRLLDDAVWVTDDTKGYVVVPVRLGLLIPADSGLSFTRSFDTYAYEGCHMEMLGLVQNGAAALVTWNDPYVAAEIKSMVTSAPWLKGRQAVSTSLVLRKSAHSFRLQFLGQGDYVTIAKAYQSVAKARGWYVPWSEKLKTNPARAKLFGAINYKLWSLLSRRMSEDSQQEISKRVNWTFAEAAQIAEHLKHDLKLDKVLFTMGGWIHRGYDNQHPDILPTAPECGGDQAFADCARQVMGLGYLFCLHDNYQDMYRDAPSWDESFLNRNPDGTLTTGGHWAGGRAYITCSQKAVELARRPQNLPAVKTLCNANAYFIDTTYAAGLFECFSKEHPLTRVDDLHWKQILSDYARDVFGIFGSECGREWAIPHSDFFEGLTGVSGSYYHNKTLLASVGGVVVPLFELVYRDSIALYGKYGYDITKSTEYVLHHLSIGRPLNYHSIPPHLYWQQTRKPADQQNSDTGLFTRGDNGWTEGLHPLDRFVKNTYEILSPLNELTAQMPMTEHVFLTADRNVQRTVFGQGTDRVEVIINTGIREQFHTSKMGGEVALPRFGFLVEGPTFVAFHATQWNGVNYKSPALFTLRSLDGKPLNQSGRVRVFHGFGDAKIKVGDTLRTVSHEQVF